MERVREREIQAGYIVDEQRISLLKYRRVHGAIGDHFDEEYVGRR